YTTYHLNLPSFPTRRSSDLAVRQSGKLAYEKAGLGPEDVDVIEIHDCFSMTEIISSEELGFFNKGEGYIAVEQGRTKATGDVPIDRKSTRLNSSHVSISYAV